MHGFFKLTSLANQCREDARDGAYSFSSLSEKTRVANHLRYQSKSSTFSLVIWRPWVYVQSGAWALNLLHGIGVLYSMNQLSAAPKTSWQDLFCWIWYNFYRNSDHKGTISYILPKDKDFLKIFHVSQSILSRCSNCVVSTELCSSLLPNVSEPWYSNLIYWFVNSNYNVSHPVVKIANYTTVIGSFTAKWGRRRGDRGVEGGGGKVEESLLYTPALSPFVALVERETASINSKSVVLWNEFQEWFVSWKHLRAFLDAKKPKKCE